jgi:hypothetical protein
MKRGLLIQLAYPSHLPHLEGRRRGEDGGGLRRREDHYPTRLPISPTSPRGSSARRRWGQRTTIQLACPSHLPHLVEDHWQGKDGIETKSGLLSSSLTHLTYLSNTRDQESLTKTRNGGKDRKEYSLSQRQQYHIGSTACPHLRCSPTRW